jgi:hypothetical protein
VPQCTLFIFFTVFEIFFRRGGVIIDGKKYLNKSLIITSLWLKQISLTSYLDDYFVSGKILLN